MSSAARSRMVHRCNIERDTNVDAEGHRTSDDLNYQPHLQSLPCFLWSTGGREAVDPTHITAVEDLRMLIQKGIDINVRDQIHGVKDRLGRDIDVRALGILVILKKSDHQELMLQERV